ncbi:DUF2971 domain-containing protein [Salinivibrio sp. KP-1]|uniref:DUF2971 domain-containing protein n=1 Tax=Salinivibrio sp. KP-1 TaxID=1406902 RepID=UPI000614846A|nr:DUF2971 domain-containing protein [Salinivibrio sp. KP-1]KKA43743.1 hypothetical protein WN56_15555 [Salinivibrio sp. KP-1]
MKTEVDNPALIYHYTTQEALLGILQGGGIWLTDISKMNDPHEKELGLKVLEGELLIRYNDEKAREIMERVRYLTRNIIYFSCSFSDKENDLSQWRSYASDGEGFCLGFDKDSLKDFCDNGEHDFRMMKLSPVTYDSENFKELIKTELLSKDEIHRICEMSKKDSDPNDLISTIGAIVSLSCLIKDPIYSVESELRLLTEVNIDDFRVFNEALELKKKIDFTAGDMKDQLSNYHGENRVNKEKEIDVMQSKCEKAVNEAKVLWGGIVGNLNYRATKYGIAPYLTLDIRKYIKKIIIGPDNKNSIEDIRRFCVINNLEDVEIEYVGYKYRG